MPLLSPAFFSARKNLKDLDNQRFHKGQSVPARVLALTRSFYSYPVHKCGADKDEAPPNLELSGSIGCVKPFALIKFQHVSWIRANGTTYVLPALE